MSILTYQNSEVIKAEFQKRFAAHRAMDQVTQGLGFDPESQRGCFIGCTMNQYSHEAFAYHIGPQWLAHLADKIFEGLPKEEAPQFGTDLLDAIPVGKDIEHIQWLLAIARHKRQLTRLEGNAEPYAEQCRAAIKNVIIYCEKMYAKEFAEESAWSARSAAESAESAAWSAASAARSARSARSAESARSAARSAAWSEYQCERDTLLEILRSIK